MKILDGLRRLIEIMIMILYAILCLATLLGVVSRVIPGLETVSWSMEISR